MPEAGVEEVEHGVLGATLVGVFGIFFLKEKKKKKEEEKSECFFLLFLERFLVLFGRLPPRLRGR